MQTKDKSLKNFAFRKFEFNIADTSEKTIKLSVSKDAKCTIQDEEKEDTFFIEFTYSAKSIDSDTFTLNIIGAAKFKLDCIPTSKDEYEELIKSKLIPMVDAIIIDRVKKITKTLGHSALDLTTSLE